jgi:hypothetical protein
MKVTKTAMREEALKRMEMLGLDESVIEDFRKRKRVLVSDQQFVDFDPDSRGSSEITTSFPNFFSVNGRMYQMFTTAPSEERLQLIKELENHMKVLVYHVIRIETDHDNDNNNHAIYVFLTVWGFQEDWESERSTITNFSTVYGHQTLHGYPQTVSHLEYGEIPFKPYMGCLVVTNVR